ncbi:HAD-IA family hydrolase [Pseudidiomarina terrestris]|uniref:HAD-IA family hydrolase n=1 Tax=Pseudidiomarina terrestris TaxID=2820060 RepID=A0AAW7R0B5_9GAMM|nr:MULTISPECIES: HAD-IA family hydrolase [unclassified Pseudidiomarina]MDN7124718.1 HAD-IA family hydrolase [Pseudidiomarina sp. 1APP75-32.1]MDN7129808.1 HAD-IA family hydrolase [Pseudidiomarina sp. 1APR75-15]MDN7136415.1 HAD-IA family hydrolase [Pseudidiomarina sp. 1ASP75-5]MDN7137935.1 HAD-IA family hydrolase [Pseudidiomarina sp. 1ASP75-14]
MQFFRRLQPVQALSFDLDDTLYDNVPVMQKAEAESYRALCQRYPEAARWSVQQWAQRRWQLMQNEPDLASDMTALRLATLSRGLQELGVAEAAARQGADDIFATFLHFRNQVQIAPDTHQLLQALAERYPLVALSNGNVDTAAIGLRDYFSAVVQPGSGLRGKPHSDMFAKIGPLFPQIAPQGWLHVGDSPYADILGAQRMGWQTAWYRSGIYVADQLHVLPVFAFDELRQLQQLLLK